MEHIPKTTDREDLAWFAEFAESCEHGSMTTEELLGRALIHAIDTTRDVQYLFEGRRSDHAAFWDRFERLTGIECKHEDEGWCFFQCGC